MEGEASSALSANDENANADDDAGDGKKSSDDWDENGVGGDASVEVWDGNPFDWVVFLMATLRGIMGRGGS